jgi:uncharacterized protein (TIGR02646 family)
MRFVDLDGKQPPEAWRAKAAALSLQLEAMQDNVSRTDFIEANRGTWADLKPWLSGFSNNKCWFSESRDSFSHFDVEHFRPKGAARELDGTLRENGYWWLAFDWTNFRLCGNVGNRKKGAFFPLKTGTHHATATNRNVDDEIPYLLDPTRPDDPLLLCFDDNGDVRPLPGMDEWTSARASESIKRYKLSEHEPLVEARRDVWSKCAREVDRCSGLMAEHQKAASATKKEAIRQQMLRLREMVSSDAEFSATASDCLRSRPELWARRIAAGT